MNTRESTPDPSATGVAEMTPPLPASPMRRIAYRFANVDHVDIVNHSDRTRWTRAATTLALYAGYASFGMYSFLQGVLNDQPVLCAIAAAALVMGIVSFDRGVLGTTNANLEHALPDPDDDDPGGTLMRAHLNPLLPMSRAMVWLRFAAALLMAVIVTEQLNAALFQNQIQRQVQAENDKEKRALRKSPNGPLSQANKRAEDIEASVKPLSKDVSRIKGEVKLYNRKAIAASQGNDVTGVPGCAEQCQIWLDSRANAQARLEVAQNRVERARENAQDRIDSLQRSAKKEQREAERAIDRDEGGLRDTLALFAYLKANPEGLIMFVPLTVLLLLLDLAALLLKLGARNSVYEHRQAMHTRQAWIRDAAATWKPPNAGGTIGDLATSATAYIKDKKQRSAAAREAMQDAILDRIKEAVKTDPEITSKVDDLAREDLLDTSAKSSPKKPTSRPKKVGKQSAAGEQSEVPGRFPERVAGSGELKYVDLIPGAIVTGHRRRWRLEERLPAARQGGNSIVFTATAVNGPEGTVVIKFIDMPRERGAGVSDIDRGRARREFRNVEKLPDSPFIAPILDKAIEPHEGALWLATPFAQHGSLSNYFSAYGGRWSLREALLVAGQVSAAISDAHAAGIVHRDIKPDNGLVFTIEELAGPGGITIRVPGVKVTDWGLARVITRIESALDVVPGGTLGFSPPQARTRAAADPRDDLYSLGCLIWWLTTGEPPLLVELGPNPKPDQYNKLARLREESPRPWDDLKILQPQVPTELAMLVRRLMAYDRADRAPNDPRPIERVEREIKQMLDDLDDATTRTGIEVYVGPRCEPPHVRQVIQAGSAEVSDFDQQIPETQDDDEPGTDDDDQPASAIGL